MIVKRPIRTHGMLKCWRSNVNCGGGGVCVCVYARVDGACVCVCVCVVCVNVWVVPADTPMGGMGVCGGVYFRTVYCVYPVVGGRL